MPRIPVRRHARRKPPQKHVRRDPAPSYPVIIQSESSMGVPLRVVVDDDSIYAYRTEPAIITSTRYSERGKKVHIQAEEELSRLLSKEDVMHIRDLGGGEYLVDFDAGFQRGRITVGRDELCVRSHWPQLGKGYIKWIGLSCEDLVIRKWLSTKTK